MKDSLTHLIEEHKPAQLALGGSVSLVVLLSE